MQYTRTLDSNNTVTLEMAFDAEKKGLVVTFTATDPQGREITGKLPEDVQELHRDTFNIIGFPSNFYPVHGHSNWHTDDLRSVVLTHNNLIHDGKVTDRTAGLMEYQAYMTISNYGERKFGLGYELQGPVPEVPAGDWIQRVTTPLSDSGIHVLTKALSASDSGVDLTTLDEGTLAERAKAYGR